MRWIISLLFLVLFQYYSFQAIKTTISNKWILFLYVILVILVIGNLLFHTVIIERSTQTEPRLMYAIGFFISLFTFQALITIILLGEDILRVPQGVYSFFTKMPGETKFLPERRKIISQIAIGIAAIPFAVSYTHLTLPTKRIV